MSLREYILPPLEMLHKPPSVSVQPKATIHANQAILICAINSFGIGAHIAHVAVGPTITRYEVQLEPGVLVRKIAALADNLAMSLSAIDVRVEAPVPGKGTIGIEVPNDVTQMVSLRECLSTNEFMNAPSNLTFALGKDVSGEYKYADLTRMPHLLIGGSTNSGKSVFLHSLIASILYRATPREVKFVMIDLKRIELSLYDGIPHLLSPVIKDIKQVAGIFHSILKEMEERYDRFARLGVRNIDGFNSRVASTDRMPFIVVAVDELALLMQQGLEVETSICRLAQLARATGIHLIIATQRPSVDVVTGAIKANISSRIAFAVATQIDSRTIIDMPGADRLIGRGDMLYMPIDADRPVRIQGCYIGENEIKNLVKYLRNQKEAVYTMISSRSNLSDDADEIGDEFFEPCVRWLVMQGQCSISALQRKFKIGYTRAARLVEVMEARQIVGFQDGVKPREILLRSENLEAFFAGTGRGDAYETEPTTSSSWEEVPSSPAFNSQREKQRPSLEHETLKRSVPSANASVLLSELNGLTGLGQVKADVTQLVNFLRVQKLRKDKGLSVPDQSLHMVFTGNPGTGKTTIARLIAQIYKSMGILSKGQFVETDRAGLVGGYLGQTAIKTKEVVESALGGVLFIDEAYSLTDSTHGHDLYGQEAVATLLKMMEDHRDDLIVIVAGYTEPMQKFIKSNPGLQSRFNKFLHFDDYVPAELTEIFGFFAAQADYKLHPATELKLHNVFADLYAARDETFGNARLARNLFEKAINAHANRMVSAGAVDEASLVTLYPEDVPNG